MPRREFIPAGHFLNWAAFQFNFAGGFNQSGNRTDKRGFSAAVGTENAVVLPVFKSKGNFVQYFLAVVAGTDVFQIQQHSPYLLLRK